MEERKKEESLLLGKSEYNGPAEPVRQFMLSQAPNSTEPHTESG